MLSEAEKERVSGLFLLGALVLNNIALANSPSYKVRRVGLAIEDSIFSAIDRYIAQKRAEEPIQTIDVDYIEVKSEELLPHGKT